MTPPLVVDTHKEMKIHVNKNYYEKYTTTTGYGSNQNANKAKVRRFKELASIAPYNSKTTKKHKSKKSKHNKTIATPAFISEFLQCAQLHLNAEKAFLGIYNIQLSRLTKKDQKFIKLLYQISQANFEAAIQEHALKDPSNANAAKLLSTIRGMLFDHQNTNNTDQNQAQAPQLNITLTDKAAKTKPTSTKAKPDPVVVVDKDKKIPQRQPLKLANS